MATTRLIRAKNVSDSEWKRIRQRALQEGISTAAWVGRALHDALLKGAKP